MTDKKNENEKIKEIRDYGDRNRIFERKGIYVPYVNHTWAVDLIDMSKSNAGYILNCIDIFSRKAESVAINSKSSPTLKQALETMFEKFGAKPLNLWTDKEGGIYGLKKWLQEKGVNIYSLNNSYLGPNTHANPIAERFNKTIGDFMMELKAESKPKNYRQLIHETVRKFIPIYNNQIHGTLKAKPNDVYNGTFDNKKIKDIHVKNLIKNRESFQPFEIGSYVLLQKNFKNRITAKTDTTYYTKPYKIINVKLTNPITYVLDGIEGTFYRDQLKLIYSPSGERNKKI